MNFMIGFIGSMLIYGIMQGAGWLLVDNGQLLWNNIILLTFLSLIWNIIVRIVAARFE